MQNACNIFLSGSSSNVGHCTITAESQTFGTGTINATTGQVSGVHDTTVVYIKGNPGASTPTGRIFKVDLLKSGSHTPVQVSNLGNACGFIVAGTTLPTQYTKLADYANPDNSWLMVALPGPDNVCFSSDDTYSLVRLSMAATAAPAATGLTLFGVVALHDTSGAIAGFISGEPDRNKVIQLWHRDANFATPTQVSNPTNGIVGATFVEAGLGSVYVAGRLNENDASSATDRLYKVSSNGTFSPALYTYLGPGYPDTLADSVADANTLYFVDNGRIIALSRAGSGSTVLASGQNSLVQPMQLTATRVVFDTTDSSGNVGVFSVPRNASNAQPTPLVVAQGSAGGSASLRAVDPSGMVYINGNVLIPTPTTSALSVHDDGTGKQTTAAAQWLGTVSAPSIANVYAQLAPAPLSVVLGTTDPTTNNGLTLTAYSSSTAASPVALGSIAAGVLVGNTYSANDYNGPAGANPLSPTNFGDEGGFLRLALPVTHGSGALQDAYLANIGTAGSLVGVSTGNATTGNNQGNNIYVPHY